MCGAADGLRGRVRVVQALAAVVSGMRRDDQRGALPACRAIAGSGKCSDVETAGIGTGDWRWVAVTTYSGADQLVIAQDVLDKHVTSSAAGRCLECGALGPCQRTRAGDEGLPVHAAAAPPHQARRDRS